MIRPSGVKKIDTMSVPAQAVFLVALAIISRCKRLDLYRCSLLLLLCFCGPIQAEPANLIAILIDDLGDNHALGEQALHLPGAVSYAFLPMTSNAAQLAREAHELGRDVLLHAPMQSEMHLKLMGPGALTLAMSETELRTQLRNDIASIPFVTGFNNHMGSVLTKDPERMRWVMEEALAQQLFFVDSRTTGGSVAGEIAAQIGLRHRGRDVFLDNDPNPEAIRRQFSRLLAAARSQGSALAIGHPHETTLTVLAELLPQLGRQNIHLVAVSDLLAIAPRTDPDKLYATTANAFPPLTLKSANGIADATCHVPAWDPTLSSWRNALALPMRFRMWLYCQQDTHPQAAQKHTPTSD